MNQENEKGTAFGMFEKKQSSLKYECEAFQPSSGAGTWLHKAASSLQSPAQPLLSTCSRFRAGTARPAFGRCELKLAKLSAQWSGLRKSKHLCPALPSLLSPFAACGAQPDGGRFRSRSISQAGKGFGAEAQCKLRKCT